MLATGKDCNHNLGTRFKLLIQYHKAPFVISVLSVAKKLNSSWRGHLPASFGARYKRSVLSMSKVQDGLLFMCKCQGKGKWSILKTLLACFSGLRFGYKVALLQTTVSVAAPASTITDAPDQLTAASTIQFRFTGASGTASFECQLYGSSSSDGNYTACTSPQYAPSTLYIH